MLDELADRQADILGDLPQQRRRDIPARMKRHCRATTSGIAELLVRSALPHFDETRLNKNGGNLDRLQNGDVPHALRNRDVLDTDELRFELGIAVLEEHGNNFLQIAIELVQRGALRMGAGEAGTKPTNSPVCGSRSMTAE